jgi:hypothetical protein
MNLLEWHGSKPYSLPTTKKKTKIWLFSVEWNKAKHPFAKGVSITQILLFTRKF